MFNLSSENINPRSKRIEFHALHVVEGMEERFYKLCCLAQELRKILL